MPTLNIYRPRPISCKLKLTHKNHPCMAHKNRILARLDSSLYSNNSRHSCLNAQTNDSKFIHLIQTLTEEDNNAALHQIQ